jgi:dsDNA-binding SOS-regulon protein
MGLSPALRVKEKWSTGLYARQPVKLTLLRFRASFKGTEAWVLVSCFINLLNRKIYMSDIISQTWQTPDGKTFATKAEATEHVRKPQVKEALLKVTDNNEELSEFLAENRDEVAEAFDTGTIRRVTKAEKKKLAAACERLAEIFKDSNDHKLAFLADNLDALQDSFRWPTQQRMTPEEKAAAVKVSLTSLISDNPALVDWVVANQEQLMACFEAGKVKRPVSEKAADGLARYRAQQAALKAAKAESEAA